MCQIRADFTGIKRRIFIPYLYYVYARSPMRIMRAGQYARTRMRERHVSNMLNNIMAQKNVPLMRATNRTFKQLHAFRYLLILHAQLFHE